MISQHGDFGCCGQVNHPGAPDFLPLTHSFWDGRSTNDPIAKWEKQRDDDLNIILVVVSFVSHVRLHELTRRQAGLFSAVTSAFIIYIHPQLQSDPEEESAALLRVILYKMDNTTFGGDVPELPMWNGPPNTVVAALVFLYLSLGVTTGSALISILVKQLLNIYTPGPPPRVTRFLRKMILFLSFLLQLALLFSCCALVVYIWRINILVAAVILILTACITSLAIYLIVSVGSY